LTSWSAGRGFAAMAEFVAPARSRKRPKKSRTLYCGSAEAAEFFRRQHRGNLVVNLIHTDDAAR